MIWRMLLFALAFTTIIGVTHAYIYRRLVRDAWPGDARVRRRGRRVFLLLALAMVSGIVLARLLPRGAGVQPYVAGLHRHGERTWIHVNRGTGYWGPPMRLNTPGEVTLVRFV